MHPKARGQVLIIAAAAIPAIAAIFIFTLAFTTMFNGRNHVRRSLHLATAAGVREVDFDSLANGRLLLDEEAAVATTQAVFEASLATQSYGLGASPQEIAEQATITAHNDTPWASPYTGIVHQSPTIAVVTRVPFDLPVIGTHTLTIIVETEVNQP